MNTQDDLLEDGLVGSPCSPRDSQESSPTPQFQSMNSSAFSLFYDNVKRKAFYPSLFSLLQIHPRAQMNQEENKWRACLHSKVKHWAEACRPFREGCETWCCHSCFIHTSRLSNRRLGKLREKLEIRQNNFLGKLSVHVMSSGEW